MKNPLIRMALGASVPHKKATENMQTEAMPIPAKIYLPMSMHIGAACVPCVQKGDKVFVGSLVGKAENFVSSNIYSSVSGTVEGVTTLMQDNGQLAETVVIESDGFATADEDIKPPVVTDRETFIKAIRESGLVGLGGAGFPTFIKLSPTNIDKIDTLIINGAECEPYITADNREFIECSEDVLAGIELCKTYLGIKKVIIGIERNKPKAIDIMFSLTQGDKTLKVKPLKSHYPQGAEKIIIETLTGKKVPQGGLPSDVGVIVLNVATVSFISKYIKTGMPLVTKRLTVDGDAVANPKNVLARIGTPIGDVLDFCGGFSKPAVKVIMGGPMMGKCAVSTTQPVTKTCNAILAFSEKMAHIPSPQPCIRCGRCILSCPMGLSPVETSDAFKAQDTKLLTKLKADLCMECGVCSYVCPAKRPVTQTMSLAKEMQKSAVKKEANSNGK